MLRMNQPHRKHARRLTALTSLETQIRTGIDRRKALQTRYEAETNIIERNHLLKSIMALDSAIKAREDTKARLKQHAQDYRQ
jgi:hypothetical protein